MWKLLTQLHSLQIDLDVQWCGDMNGSHLTAYFKVWKKTFVQFPFFSIH